MKQLITDFSSVDKFQQDSTVPMNTKQQRMKMEIQYVPDSSLSAPRSNAIFRIRTKKQQGQKSREYTAEEFGCNLKLLIEKKTSAAGNDVSLSDFISTLTQMTKK